MAGEPGPRGRPQRTERGRRPAKQTRPTRSGQPRRGPWGRWAETRCQQSLRFDPLPIIEN